MRVAVGRLQVRVVTSLVIVDEEPTWADRWWCRVFGHYTAGGIKNTMLGLGFSYDRDPSHNYAIQCRCGGWSFVRYGDAPPRRADLVYERTPAPSIEPSEERAPLAPS